MEDHWNQPVKILAQKTVVVEVSLTLGMHRHTLSKIISDSMFL